MPRFTKTFSRQEKSELPFKPMVTKKYINAGGFCLFLGTTLCTTCANSKYIPQVFIQINQNNTPVSS